MGRISLSASPSPRLGPAPSSLFPEHHLPAPTLPHSGAHREADSSLASDKPRLQTLPTPLQPAPHNQAGAGACWEQRHRNSSKEESYHHTKASAPRNWAPGQVNSGAGTRNLIISAPIPEATLIFSKHALHQLLGPQKNREILPSQFAKAKDEAKRKATRPESCPGSFPLLGQQERGSASFIPSTRWGAFLCLALCWVPGTQ